jgi:hypothetical protein
MKVPTEDAMLTISRLMSGLSRSVVVTFALLSVAMPNAAFAAPPGPLVPEMDPGAVASALALLVGGALLLTSKRTRT